MLPCKRFSIWVVVGLLVLASAAVAQAQFRGRPPQQGMPTGGEPIPPATAVKGTIESIMGTGIVMSAGENEKWRVIVQPDASIRVTGPAELDFLQVGLYVQFSGAVDKKQGRVKDEVGKLTVFTPSKNLGTGVATDFGAAGGGGAPGKPGAELLAPAGGDLQSQMVSGMITSIRANKLTVNVPGLSPKLKVDLVESPTIDVNLDFRYARAGDNLEITKGTKYEKQFGVVATEGKITLAQPLSGHKKKGFAAGKAASSRTKKPSADEPAAKPEKPAKN
jgi:hypothetical protein